MCNRKEGNIMADEIVFEKAIVEQKLYENFGHKGNNYNPNYAFDIELLLKFIKESQPKEYDELRQSVSDDEIIGQIYDWIEEKGIIVSLLKPIMIKPATSKGVSIRLFIKKPNNNINPTEWDLYKKNIFFVQKELYYKADSKQRIDISIGVNGIHLFAVELKNGTTQTYADAEIQLKHERDHSTPYFKHIICSFAMDRSFITFCPNLNEDATFLPFNKGYNFGAGNPPLEYPEYPVQHFWQEVMTIDGITNLLQNYIFIDPKKGMVFPRYHQFTCSNLIDSDAMQSAKENKLHNYLIQAAPGSGKTLMIAWTAYKLSYLNTADNVKVFDKVIVVSNRLIINSQLSTQISNIGHQTGYIVSPENSEKLAEALNGDSSIIIANMQKFLEAFDKVSGTSGKRFAILIDEGHDSTSGDYMMAIKKATNTRSKKSIKEYVKENEPEINWDILLGKIKAANERAEGRQENAIYIAFTATPKKNTKEIFGTPIKLADRVKYEPFFHYSMKQAIEEGFILDVLKGYSSYSLYCTAVQKNEDEKIVEVMKAAGKMNEMVHQRNDVIEKKVNIFMNFFRTKFNEMDGNAKAMIVTGERQQALTYLRLIQKYIRDNKLDAKALIAFSGPLFEDGKEVTEESINNLPTDTTLEKVFHNDKNYKLLVVADKYTTGFDEEYLSYMLVDSPLHGSKVVQTLSRLNRISKDYPKKKTYIIDYINDIDQVIDDFGEFYADAKYYKKDPEQTVFELAKIVDELGLAEDKEILDGYDCIALRNYDSTDKFNSKLTAIIQNVKNRLDKMVNDHSEDEDERLDYRKDLTWRIRRFVHDYEVTSNVTRISDSLLRAKYYFYAFFLICIKLKTVDPTIKIVKENVDFKDIKIEEEKTVTNPDIPEEVEIVSGGAARRKTKVVRDDLKEVIKLFNEKIGLPPEDRLHEDIKKFLLGNEYCDNILEDADEYGDFEDAIMTSAMDNKCNVYELITKHASYPKLIKNPDFKKHWRELVLRPILQEIWNESKTVSQTRGLILEEESDKRYYIAYGSNLNSSQMSRRCPTAVKVGTAIIDNYRLMFKKSQTGYYLTIEEAEGYKVPVGVFVVEESDEKSLDDAEGYPNWYTKKDFVLNVTDDDGVVTKLNAFAYVLPKDKELGEPSQEYINRVLVGYREFGFDESLIQEAIDYSK